MSNMSDIDRAYHLSMRPSWGPDGTLVYSLFADAAAKSSRRSREKNGLLETQKGVIVSEGRDVRFAKLTNEVR
jgi:nuclear pore complex protein Nup98-Nup96